MRKLSLLMAIILCVTVGGVYAVWTYSEEGLTVTNANSESVAVLADHVILNEAVGSFSVKENNLKLVIDQKNAEHEAELKFMDNTKTGDGYITFAFTPSENAGQAVKDFAIDSKVTISLTAPMQYPMDAEGNYDAAGTPTDIFTINSNEIAVVWTPVGNGTFEFTIDADDLVDIIELPQPSFTLDVHEEYDAFMDCLKGNIRFTLSDAR